MQAIAAMHDDTDRPHVILNVAMSADGKLDTFERQGAKISSALDAERVDRLRAESDAILVGGQTLLGDDPRLTVKSEALRAGRLARSLPENPLKVGVVSKAELKEESRFLVEGPARVIIFTTAQTDSAQLEFLRQRGVQVLVMGERRVDVIQALAELKRQGVRRLMVEGGGSLNAELLRLGLVDEIYIYIAPLIFGGAEAPTLANGAGLTRSRAIRLSLQSIDRLPEDGILIHYLVNQD
jgi:2,5-diamino-6-(ribosylamino)-4(3H)-pyrimidinone 5'-phosphate reductase